MLKVNEIFASIEGEGPYAGRPAVFVRLQGCDLNCPWCDTMYAHDPAGEAEERSIPEIKNAVLGYGINHATITGGEPLLQEDAPRLIRTLKSAGLTVSVETNGAEWIGKAQAAGAVIVMDWKMPSSGMENQMLEKNLSALYPSDALKCVIGDETDLDRVPWLLRKTRAQVFLSTVWGQVDPRKVAERMVREKWEARLQIQLHKIIWPPDMRGV